jgi:hypothetical protein
MARDSKVPVYPSGEYKGITLREWYAAFALQGIVGSTEGQGPRKAETIAKRAFEIADAMVSAIEGTAAN